MDIRAITADALEPYVLHMERQMAESGRDGAPVFNPFETGAQPSADELRPARQLGLFCPIGEPGWRRMWGAFDGDRAVGYCELVGGVLDSEMHRASLMLGLERSHWGRGLAARLLEAAVSWADGEPSLAWLYLTVFTSNAPAIRLYERFGFERIGVVEDRFRVGGQVIDEMMMVRRLAG